MSDIQAIIKLIEKGYSNSDHRDGQKQINEAVSMLRKMQEDSNLHSGQRWELSQILGCWPLYGDIEEAVKGLKGEYQWRPIETAPKDEFVACIRPSLEMESGWWSAVMIYTDGEWVDSKGKALSPLYWIPLPLPQYLAKQE